MLSEMKARNAKPKDKVYRITDVKGLCLEIRPSGGKHWRYRYFKDGKANMLSLGSYPEIGLSEARKRLAEERQKLELGSDPSEVRKAEKAVVVAKEATFLSVAESWHKVHSTKLDPANAKAVFHRLKMDVLPYIGNRPIAEIKAPDMLEVLRRVESRGAIETAARLRGWCGQVFRYAIASGMIDSDPTVNLRGALATPKVKHFAAITEPNKIKGLLNAIADYKGMPITRAALLFGMLTFVRPGNLRHAEWTEFHDLDGERPEWRIPGDKMKVKTKRHFVVPLAPQAIRILNEVRPLTGDGKYVFPSPRTNSRPMSENGVNAALRRMGFEKDVMTGHGVRAMARTIAHETLGFAPEVIEEQLAHTKAGPLRDAYDRTTHMAERVRLMAEWANWLDKIAEG